MIEGGPEPTPQQDLLAERSAQLKSRLDGSRDHSIGLSYWEEAQELLENPPSEAEDFKRVGVLLEEVLPLYFRLIQNP